jgi:hypothetical protein
MDGASICKKFYSQQSEFIGIEKSETARIMRGFNI